MSSAEYEHGYDQGFKAGAVGEAPSFYPTTGDYENGWRHGWMDAWELSFAVTGEPPELPPVRKLSLIVGEYQATQAHKTQELVKMHQSVMEYVQGVAPITEQHTNKTVLEVGSFNVNGSVRRIFGDRPYVGIDMRPGPGVDEVIEPSSYWGDRYLVGTVVCTEVLEHDPNPWWTMRQIYNSVMTGGHVIITARGYDENGCFPLHDYPTDLWRFSVQGMGIMLEHAGFTVIDCKPDPVAPGVFALARADR